MLVRWVLITVAMVFCGWSQDLGKPPCNAQNRGEIWPKASARNANREIEMCTLHVWKYSWEKLTVSVSQLAKDPKRDGGSEPPRPAASRKDPRPVR